jgi:hypothetical protein
MTRHLGVHLPKELGLKRLIFLFGGNKLLLDTLDGVPVYISVIVVLDLL